MPIPWTPPCSKERTRWSGSTERASGDSPGPGATRAHCCGRGSRRPGRSHERCASSGEGAPAFVSASAVGYYGSAPGALLTEVSPRGETFLADLCGEWESAALGAGDRARVALLRTAPIVHPQGVLKPLMLLTRFGVSGPIGRGTQEWPWISLEDEVRGIRHVIDTQIAGPVNLTGPTPRERQRPGLRPGGAHEPAVRAARAGVGGEARARRRCDRGAAHHRRRRRAEQCWRPRASRSATRRSRRRWMPRCPLRPPKPVARRSRAGSRAAPPHEPACGRRRRRTRGRAGTRPASRPGAPRRRRGSAGKTASPSSRTTRPLGRTATGSSGRPPSASSRRPSCSARTPNHSSRPSAHAAMTGSTTRARPIATAIGSPLISSSHARCATSTM